MGARTNIAIVRNGSWDLYYDHWFADRLNVEFFWGPEIAIEFVEQMRPIEPDRWSELFWYNGCAVIDMDKKALLFFGGESYDRDIRRRRVWLEHMRETWTGWNIRWAHNHTIEICRYLKVPHDHLCGFFDADPVQRFRVTDSTYEKGGCLLTTIRGGDCTARRVSGDIESIELGPDHLQVLDEVTPLPSLD